MLYRSLKLTSSLLAIGLLWNAAPGLARPLIAQSGQSATPEAQPTNPLLLGNPASESPPANVIVPIVPSSNREQSESAPGKTVVPTNPLGNSPTSPPTPVTESGTPSATPAVDFPQPSDLIKPLEALPTPPVATEGQPTSGPPSQPQSAPSSPVPASGLSNPQSPTPTPTETSTPTTPTPASPETSTPTAAPSNSDALPPTPPGLQDQPGNIIRFGTEPSPPPLIAEPLRLQIKLSQRQVTLYRGEDVVKRYPIAVGRPGWETPKGKFQVRQMFKDPIWVSPLQKGITIPGGDPENPLGRFWIGFWTDGKNWIGFHGTPNPRSVGTAASHGCIRMYNKDIEDLFQRISLGIEVTVVD